MQQASSFVRLKGWEREGVPRHLAIGGILALALVAFELFNFDTTQYALHNLLGGVKFAGLAWATILAVAFCAIDFAGLVRFFTPERGRDEPREVWFLLGAWLLGATMNALMTWWAVSLTLLDHEFGNEVLSRAQLLQIVPVFVAVLVWLTRILFIGGLTVAGERLVAGRFESTGLGGPSQRPVAPRPVGPVPAPRTAQPVFSQGGQPALPHRPVQPKSQPARPEPARPRPAGRSRKRPPMPRINRSPLNNIEARRR